MPTSEKLPSLHYTEYAAHLHIERDRKRSEEDARGETRLAYARNEYAAHRQYATAVSTFLHRRVYLRDAISEARVPMLGNFFVHNVRESTNQSEALVFLQISSEANVNTAIWVSVHLGTYIMSCK